MIIFQCNYSTVRPQINADDWTLIINRTGRGDEGRWVEVTVHGDQHYTEGVARYECSVNTLPKISHSVDLVLDTMEEDADRAMMDSPFQVHMTWHHDIS